MKPQLGDIGFAVIGGGVGAFVAWGQFVLGDSCRYTHAFIVTGENEVVEAMPRGARVAALAGRNVPRKFRYARLPQRVWDAAGSDRKALFTITARSYVGVPYGFSTYLSLAAVQWGLPAGLLRRYVSNNGRMICSQLIDQALSDAGVHLFTDGRIPQDVTPGDLYYRLQDEEFGATFFDWREGE